MYADGVAKYKCCSCIWELTRKFEGGEKEGREEGGDFDECSDHFAINKEISGSRDDATHCIANQDATQLCKIQFACQEDKYTARKFELHQNAEFYFLISISESKT